MKQKSGPDTPGALFSVFKMEAVESIFEAIEKDKITIAFSRQDGGIDVKVPIELTVEETDAQGKRKRSTRATSEFVACASELLK